MEKLKKNKVNSVKKIYIDGKKIYIDKNSWEILKFLKRKTKQVERMLKKYE